MLLTHSSLFLSLLLTFSYANGSDCGSREPRSKAMKLKQDLLCGYDKDVRPVPHHSNKTNVHIIIAPRVIEFRDEYDSFSVKAWVSMNWKDELLSWDKLEYDGMDQFFLDSSQIWVPDLMVYDTKHDSFVNDGGTVVALDHEGHVYSFVSPRLLSHCVADWTYWPYDIHSCNVTLGSRQYLGSAVDFDFVNTNGLYMKYLLPSKDWELISYSSYRNVTEFGPKNETDSVYMVRLVFQFVLKRHASVYVASYLIPGIVSAILSLAVLWIPSQKSERTAILCTLVILLSLYLQYLAYKIPSNGDKLPNLVCFYRDCLAVTGLLIIETLVTRSMASWDINPSYLQSTFQLVASNKVLQFILISDMDPKSSAKLMEAGDDEGSTLVVKDESSQQWQMFANLVNRACFLVLLVLYILLIVSLLPFYSSSSK